MAIWDRQEDTIITGSADSHKCMSCGGNLMFQPKEGILRCRHCGNEYYPEVFEVNEILESHKLKSAGKEEEGKHEIYCNACGAVVITDKNTVSTFCAFCGSPAVVNRNMENEFRPDYIIPFKLTHKDAENAIKEWASDRKLLPFRFNTKANYSKITGLYVPFWLVDADCHMNTVGSGIRKVREQGVLMHHYYDVRREGIFKMCKVPFDGSKRINDRVMEAIEPFDYSEMVPFTSGYLQGFYSEKFDQTPEDLSVRITNRFRDYMYDVSKEYMHLNKYEEYHHEVDQSKPENFDFKYALLPVWFMSFKYKNIYYRIAVNGQTGEVAGTTPESSLKLGLLKFWQGLKSYSLVLLLDVIIAIVMGFLTYLYTETKFSSYSRYGTGPSMMLGVYILVWFVICLVLTICNSLGIRFMDDNSLYGKIIEKMVIKSRKKIVEMGNDVNVMDKMPDVYQYLDKTYKSDFNMDDKLAHAIIPDSLISDLGKNNSLWG